MQAGLGHAYSGEQWDQSFALHVKPTASRGFASTQSEARDVGELLDFRRP